MYAVVINLWLVHHERSLTEVVIVALVVVTVIKVRGVLVSMVVVAAVMLTH